MLAVAERELTPDQAAAAVASGAEMEKLCRSDLTPCGLLGLADTPRPPPASCSPISPDAE